MSSINSLQNRRKKRRLILPFLDTSFATNFKWFLILWPVWWLLGVEQFLFFGFTLWEFLRLLLGTKGKLNINVTLVLAFFLACWWVVPILWIIPEERVVFLKDTTTVWTLVFLTALFLSNVRNKRAWWQIVHGLAFFSGYIAIGSLVFIFGVWTGEIKSVIGMLLPDSLINSSVFFNSIGFRNLGGIENVGFLSARRSSSLALEAGGLGSITIMLLPFVGWLTVIWHGRKRVVGLLVLFGLFVALLFSKVRMVYLAFLLGLGLWAILVLGKRLRKGILFGVLVVIILFMITFLFAIFSIDAVNELYQSIIVDWRRGSFNVRMDIYAETFRLLPEHWLAGWGTAVGIESLSSHFSAGTHSSILAMLFQHGVVGLILYLGIWLTIWQRIVKGIAKDDSLYSFWVMAAIAMFSFNIREITTSWWWDQTITIVIWTLWGLILSAPNAFKLRDT